MVGKGGTYPITAGLDNLDGSTVSQEIQTALQKFYKLPKVRDNKELDERIDEYFRICAESKIRPGFATLAMCIGTSRQTFWRWCNGEGSDRERQEICLRAKTYIEGYLESAFMSGSVSPVSGIFLLKNWFNYKDTVTVEPVNNGTLQADKTPEQIQQELIEQIPVDD